MVKTSRTIATTVIGVTVGIFIGHGILYATGFYDKSEPTYTPAEAEILHQLDQNIELVKLINKQCREIILPEMIRQKMSPISRTEKE